MISYGNFRNPLGLAWRMLRSGNRAAYSALFREALGIAMRPVDFVLSFVEPWKSQPAEASQLPLIFIVGPPRGGTTLVYQALAHCLDVSYISNLQALFPKSPIAIGRLFGWMVGRPRADFRNYFGQSARLSGVHDGFFIWNRWLGDDRYSARDSLEDVERRGMAAFFANWLHAFPKPFLNKNNRCTDCIELLANSLPNAVFVVVRREPVANVRSLINAREQVQGDKRHRWGLKSRRTEGADPLQYVRDVCLQVSEINDSIKAQTKNVEPSRIVEIDYETFCENPNAVVTAIVERIPSVQRAANSELPEKFRRSVGTPLTADEEALISQMIGNSE